ncbi:MAG: hypothetical protein HY809_10665 [Nitrospirae bacterium]|nr:hypothetical protein [Nitrospirota bacterium]
MEIDVSIGKESISVEVSNPFRFDAASGAKDIFDFGSRLGVDLSSLGIEKLIPRMIRGVAGCEQGCPSDAKSLVRNGFGKFRLEYIEGGILSASHTLGDGKEVSVKIFPDFN